ncbi:hypothetical protein Taro_039482 [Colocasia esculenta]|uniref:BHLH domain-containing protein n=1 Tax=Colocasia esculenta TaxID=4460 RepID=A0A843WAS8_COLES|nr:hypothetical protein [Colocasia esculenta]
MLKWKTPSELRVRRERIREKMKMLQDLVPSCDKLDSLKDSSSTSSFPAVGVDQKTEGIEDLGADEIAKEIRNVNRQNNITHGAHGREMRSICRRSSLGEEASSPLFFFLQKPPPNSSAP